MHPREPVKVGLRGAGDVVIPPHWWSACTYAEFTAAKIKDPWNSIFPESKHPPTLPICDFALQIDRKALTERLLQRKNPLQKPTSLGAHLRNHRLLAGQTQRQAAAQIGVLREVYDRWERDQTEPPVGFWKRISAFIGYYPFPQNGGGTADLVLIARRVQGLSQYALGRKLGVIAKTVRLWENGFEKPDPDQLKRLLVLAADASTSPSSGAQPQMSGLGLSAVAP